MTFDFLWAQTQTSIQPESWGILNFFFLIPWILNNHQAHPDLLPKWLCASPFRCITAATALPWAFILLEYPSGPGDSAFLLTAIPIRVQTTDSANFLTVLSNYSNCPDKKKTIMTTTKQETKLVASHPLEDEAQFSTGLSDSRSGPCLSLSLHHLPCSLLLLAQ